MIIAISGRIGSGKDTVGKIIQHLTSEWADEEFQDTDMLDVRSNWKIKKFAGKLKQIASILTGIPAENFEDQEFKKLDMSPEWGMTYREFFQNLGTEAMRDGLHANVWMNALFADYKEEFISGGIGNFHDPRPSYKSIGFPNWIITDMRFLNELEAVKDRGGISIRVNRYPKMLSSATSPDNIKDIPFNINNPIHKNLWEGECARQHSSETALDDAEFDYVIDNNGTIEDFIEKVRELLIKLKII